MTGDTVGALEAELERLSCASLVDAMGRSGAVVIPADSLRRVLDEAHRIEAEDARAVEQIQGEDPAAVVRDRN